MSKIRLNNKYFIFLLLMGLLSLVPIAATYIISSMGDNVSWAVEAQSRIDRARELCSIFGVGGALYLGFRWFLQKLVTGPEALIGTAFGIACVIPTIPTLLV